MKERGEENKPLQTILDEPQHWNKERTAEIARLNKNKSTALTDVKCLHQYPISQTTRRLCLRQALEQALITLASTRSNDYAAEDLEESLLASGWRPPERDHHTGDVHKGD